MRELPVRPTFENKQDNTVHLGVHIFVGSAPSNEKNIKHGVQYTCDDKGLQLLSVFTLNGGAALPYSRKGSLGMLRRGANRWRATGI